MSMADRTIDGERRFTGRHLLYALLGFFGVMLVANVIFIWLALSTFSGATSKTAYEDGLAFNERLDAAADQKARGWQGELRTEGDRVVLTMERADGRPLGGLTLDALFLRPTHDGMDRRLPMSEIAPGRYSAPLALPAPGNWDVIVTGSDGQGLPFETRSRIWVD